MSVELISVFLIGSGGTGVTATWRTAGGLVDAAGVFVADA